MGKNLKNNINILGFGAFVLVSFALACAYITMVSGAGGKKEGAAGINPEAGKEVFFGDGLCSTCHSVGGEGSATRCPNQGDLMVRMAKRLIDRKEQTGKDHTALDYLVESIVDPAAYIVEGFGDIMPKVFEPPILLSQEKILAVIAYMQTLGGDEILEANIEAVAAMKDRIPESKGSKEKPWEPPLPVDLAAGEDLFFNEEGPAACVKCHTLGGKGGKVGPVLTGIGAVQRPEYFIESILKPSETIVGGYETMYMILKDGMAYNGIVQSQSEEEVVLVVDEEGEMVEYVFYPDEIEQMQKQDISIMPANFNEMLNVQELYNIVAFLSNQK